MVRKYGHALSKFYAVILRYFDPAVMSFLSRLTCMFAILSTETMQPPTTAPAAITKNGNRTFS